MLGVLLICIITPYNDFVLGNTYVIGNSLPIGAMLVFFVIAVLINAPLSRYLPAQALSTGEMGVAFAVVLVGCALPSSALMRYLPPSLVYPFWQARSDAETLRLLESIKIARWLFPSFKGDSPRQWMNDPIVTGYAGRWTGEGPPPYAAWIRPMLAWGVYVAFLYGAFLCLIAILRRQWYENERLPFPLATIQVAILEAPAPGKFFSPTMSSRSFWVCFFIVFAIHVWNGLFLYWPKYFPEIPLNFDLRQVFSESPWRYADGDLFRSWVYLTAAAISYFLPGAVSFSMWFFYVLWQVWKMMLGVSTGDPGTPGQGDQMFGGLAAYVLIVLWIGRRHWWLVICQAFRGQRPGEPAGRYLSYRGSFWGLVACLAGLVAFNTLAGATVGGAIVITTMVTGGLFIVARIVAETGLLQPGSTFFPTRPWLILGSLGWAKPTSLTTVYLSGEAELLHHDVRESFGVFASHGVRVLDQTTYAGGSMSADDHAARKLGRRLMLLMALTIAVAYFTSFSSMLWIEYEYAAQKKPDAKVVNEYASAWGIMGHMTYPSMDYMNQRFSSPHSPAGHFTVGAAITVALSVMRFRYVWWPLHPVGYLCFASWPMSQLWFSIFVGWLVRALVLKFGGSRMYSNARTALIGVIMGEALAVSFWLIIGMALGSMGMVYKTVKILPD